MVLSSPASAQGWQGAAIGAGPAFPAGPSTAGAGFGFPSRHHWDGDRRHGDRRGPRGFDGAIYAGGWDRDYQGDTAWRPGSFNDWWHDRPDRAFPRWMRNNQSCDRQYWTGAGWTC
jgi:hypothetical protein